MHQGVWEKFWSFDLIRIVTKRISTSATEAMKCKGTCRNGSILKGHG
jgi:hypothetical protein